MKTFFCVGLFCRLGVRSGGLPPQVLKLKVLKGVVPVTVGSPTMLRDNGFLLESLSSGNLNDLCVFCAVLVFFVLHPEMEQGFVQQILCYDLLSPQTVRTKSVVHWGSSLNPNPGLVLVQD